MEEEDLSAHEILEQHISNCVAITGKAIRNAIREHEALKELYQGSLNRVSEQAREHQRLQALYEELAEERTKTLLEKSGADAIVGAIKELTDLIREAVIPPVIHIRNPISGDAVERMQKAMLEHGYKSVPPPTLIESPAWQPPPTSPAWQPPPTSPAWQPPTTNDSTAAPQPEAIGEADGGSSSNGSPR